MDWKLNPQVRPGVAVLGVSDSQHQEDLMNTRSSLPFDLLHRYHPGELSTPLLCLFVITAFTGLITRA